MSEYDEITGDENTLDSRDIEARIEYLQDEFDKDVQSLDEDELQELIDLKSLKEELEGYCADWLHGAQLIADFYFTEYTKELLQDIGDLPSGIPWYITIDWESTASNIQMDYTTADFGDTTYYVR